MLSLTEIVFAAVVVGQVAAIAAVLVSLVWPRTRIWPPPGSFAASFGLEGQLLTTGLYGLPRNPQTVAFIVGYVGFALLSNSALAAITAGLESLQLALLPFAEEPWLRARFGRPYEDYERRVPRFLALRRRRG